MPYSTVTYTADGLETDFLITWNYLDTDHITVEVNDVLTTDVSSTHQFALIDSTTIRVTDLSGNAVTSGLSIELKRATPISTRAVTFAEGSALRTTDLNKNSDYLLYAMQEAVDTIDVAAQEGAATAQEGAEAARVLAEAAQVAAESARDTSQTYLSTVQSDASTATTKAGEASTSETNAATSETNAATSEANASTSETNASNSATASANSATASANSAASILNAETNSAASATSAASSATDANSAKTDAESARDTTQGYLATVQADAATATTKASEANTSATNAASSETNAATSASNAATSASNASTSETNASTSETNAATSASNASTSETNAATSATDANTAKTAAEAALDEFTDLYLGSKSSEPSTDNDGDALQTGAIFYDTTATDVKVWNGSAWEISYVPSSNYLQKTGGTLTGDLDVNGKATLTSGELTFSGSISDPNGAAYIWRPEDNTLAFGTANEERMRLDSSGNVGIGTTSPSTKLSVTGGYISQVNAGVSTYLGEDGSGGSLVGTTSNHYLRFITNNAERMRLDSSGNLLVGTTNNTIYNQSSVEGMVYRAGNSLDVTRASGQPLILNRLTSDGTIADFRKDGSVVGAISTYGNGVVFGNANSSAYANLRFTNDEVYPCTVSGGVNDNSIHLGKSSARWDNIYATNGTIQTSDFNEKQDIASLTATEMLVGKRISALFKTFRWKDSVAEKGDNARTHTGVIAQDVQAAFTAEGLDAGDYSLFISNTWFVDAEGNEVEEGTEGAVSKTRMGIRYPELLCFVGAYNEQRFASIEARLDALEAV